MPRAWAVALGLGVVLSAVALAALWQLRRDAINGQARELAVLSLALADEIDRNLQAVEQGLVALGSGLHDGSLPADIVQAAPRLRARAELLPSLRAWWWLDGKARVLAAADAAPPPTLDSFDPSPGRLGAQRAVLSRSFRDPGSGQALIALAVPLTGPGVPAGGWLIGAMPAESLLGAFAAASPAADARMAVFRDDGARLAGAIVAAPTLAEADVAERLTPERSAALRRLSDGRQRLVDQRSLPRYGLKIVLTRELDAVLAAWREVAQLAAVGMALLLGVTAVAVALVQAADRRRAMVQRRLQVQLERSHKLESLGTLAGGVAHDFNNVLAGVQGYGELARDAAPPGSDQARQLDQLLQAALRGKALVERILAFSRGGGRGATVFLVQPVIEEVLGLLSATLRPGVVIERRLDAPGARLRGDPNQVFEAVTNLCNNAMQAMPGGGMLSVGLARQAVGRPRVLSHTRLAAGDYLVLGIVDQGAGITAEVMDRLFEPFFTTRGSRGGTGLGLALVHGVVQAFGGAIDVQSAPGQGARFTLYLPECHDDVEALPAVAVALPAGRGQTVMVVDDEPTLVALTEELLAGLGYEAVGYADAADALAALQKDPQRWDAVLTDEVMPGLSGTALTTALKRLSPDLPVLLVSGYGGPQLAERAALAGVSRVMAKPLQRAELARALAQLLR